MRRVREIKRVWPGDSYTESSANDQGYPTGFYRKVAETYGYFIKVGDTVVFLSDDEMTEADATRRAQLAEELAQEQKQRTPPAKKSRARKG